MNRGIGTVRKSSLAFACVVVAFTLFALPETARAGYLDPGSGSTAVQWIIAGVAALGRLKRNISGAVSKVFGR